MTVTRDTFKDLSDKDVCILANNTLDIKDFYQQEKMVNDFILFETSPYKDVKAIDLAIRILNAKDLELTFEDMKLLKLALMVKTADFKNKLESPALSITRESVDLMVQELIRSINTYEDLNSSSKVQDVISVILKYSYILYPCETDLLYKIVNRMALSANNISEIGNSSNPLVATYQTNFENQKAIFQEIIKSYQIDGKFDFTLGFNPILTKNIPFVIVSNHVANFSKYSNQLVTYCCKYISDLVFFGSKSFVAVFPDDKDNKNTEIIQTIHNLTKLFGKSGVNHLLSIVNDVFKGIITSPEPLTSALNSFKNSYSYISPTSSFEKVIQPSNTNMDVYNEFLKFQQLSINSGLSLDPLSNTDMKVISIIKKNYPDPELDRLYQNVLIARAEYKNVLSDDYKNSMGIPANKVVSPPNTSTSLVIIDMVDSLSNNITKEYLTDIVNFSNKKLEIEGYSDVLYSSEKSLLLDYVTKMNNDINFEDNKQAYLDIVKSYLLESKFLNEKFDPSLTPSLTSEFIQDWVSGNAQEKYSYGLVTLATKEIEEILRFPILVNEFSKITVLLNNYSNIINKIYTLLSLKISELQTLAVSLNTNNDAEISVQYNCKFLEIRDLLKKFLNDYSPIDNLTTQSVIDNEIQAATYKWASEVQKVYEEHKNEVFALDSFIGREHSKILEAWFNNNVILLGSDVDIPSQIITDDVKKIKEAAEWVGVTKYEITIDNVLEAFSFDENFNSVSSRLDTNTMVGNILYLKANINKYAATPEAIANLKKRYKYLFILSFYRYKDSLEVIDFEEEITSMSDGFNYRKDIPKNKESFNWILSNIPDISYLVTEWSKHNSRYNYLISNEGKLEFGVTDLSFFPNNRWASEIAVASSNKNSLLKEIVFLIDKNIHIMKQTLLKINGSIVTVLGFNEKDSKTGTGSLTGIWQIENNKDNNNIDNKSDVGVYVKINTVSKNDIFQQRHIKGKIAIHPDLFKNNETIDPKQVYKLQAYKFLRDKFPANKKWTIEAKEGMIDSHWSFAEVFGENANVINTEAKIIFPLLPKMIYEQYLNDKTVMMDELISCFNSAVKATIEQKKIKIDKDIDLLNSDFCNAQFEDDSFKKMEAISNLIKKQISDLAKLDAAAENIDTTSQAIDFIKKLYLKQKSQGLYEYEEGSPCIIDIECTQLPEKTGNSFTYKGEEDFYTIPTFDLEESWSKLSNDKKNEYYNKYNNKYKDLASRIPIESYRYNYSGAFQLTKFTENNISYPSPDEGVLDVLWEDYLNKKESYDNAVAELRSSTSQYVPLGMIGQYKVGEGFWVVSENGKDWFEIEYYTMTVEDFIGPNRSDISTRAGTWKKKEGGRTGVCQQDPTDSLYKEMIEAEKVYNNARTNFMNNRSNTKIIFSSRRG